MYNVNKTEEKKEQFCPSLPFASGQRSFPDKNETRVSPECSKGQKDPIGHLVLYVSGVASQILLSLVE